MALTRCPDCDHDVSTAARACPHCGHPVRRALPRDRLTPVEVLVAMVATVVLGVGLASAVGGGLGILIGLVGLVGLGWLVRRSLPVDDASVNRPESGTLGR